MAEKNSRYGKMFDRAIKEPGEPGLESKRPDGYIEPEDILSESKNPEEELIAKEEGAEEEE